MEDNTNQKSSSLCWNVDLDPRIFNLRNIDVSSLIQNWPCRLREQTSLHIEVFSDEDVMLESLERCNIKTGYRIEQDGLSILNFNVMFRGWQIAERLTVRDKYVGLHAEDELTIQITNYGEGSAFLRKGTPLGHLIISPNC